ncbi:MAG: cell division ATPase MinD [Candidatus Diapherotrites archaeon]|nr:cell division ATPase MinD [Candidatus Diapherotrites archaeon]
MGRIISLTSGKGGVGKTTIVANLGIALAQLNQKVLLIDADIAMSNLSLLFGMQGSPITLHDVLLGEADINDALYDGPANVHIIPSGLSLESYRRVDPERLESVVKEISSNYDFVLLDSPAGIEKTVKATLAASEEALIVLMPEPPSIADALKIKFTAQRLGCKPIGVIVNMVRNEPGEINAEDIMKMMELPLYGIIPFDDEIRKTFLRKKVVPTIVRAPHSRGVMEIKKTALKLVGRPVAITQEKPKEGFFAKLVRIFRRR